MSENRRAVLSAMKQSEPDATEESLRQWLEAHPADVEALKRLGSICLRSSRHEEAEIRLSKALALAPQFAEAHWLLVGTFVYRGNWKWRCRTPRPCLPAIRTIRITSIRKLSRFCSSVNSTPRLSPMNFCSANIRPPKTGSRTAGR